MRERFCPECRWTLVTDRDGRRHLEMRWVPVGAETPMARAA
ncbi:MULTISPECIES: hypothetical protein [Modestobacter]|uniref:Uncharacterized protein n=1 Tax=Modestobacter roseus TaxID=1181884 RepID=A0A562INJ4_9ACTN|nr:hypothetical protein [Modestobacter roseus]TWH72587.1 hypothetical protein JD78_01103 [Modestobacter roseus]